MDQRADAPGVLLPTLVLFGVTLALGFNAPWLLVSLLPKPSVLHFGVIRTEERYLEARFGASYRDYRRRVRRWM